MQVLSKENTINHFTPDAKPYYTVEIGETFIVEMHDCYYGQIQNEQTLTSDIDLTVLNPATGPIYVNHVTKNDVLKVDIEHIELNDTGIMITAPGLGMLGERVDKRKTKILPVENNRIHFTDHLSIPVNPMIGVIGVATDAEKIHTAVPGRHGGNIDTKEITIGNSVYLPVFQEGGLLALGDMHAAMGDGELDGTGVEISGRATLTVSKLENSQLASPVVETENSFLFLSSAVTIEEAIKSCSAMTVAHLENQLDLDFEIAYRIFSAACDVKISQLVNDLVTVKIAVPKTVLPKLFLS